MVERSVRKATKREIDRLMKGYHTDAGAGDSPYTQEFLDSMNGKKKEGKR